MVVGRGQQENPARVSKAVHVFLKKAHVFHQRLRRKAGPALSSVFGGMLVYTTCRIFRIQISRKV